MKERDCANCKHHTSDGCSSWDCEFEARDLTTDLISRDDAVKTVIRKCSPICAWQVGTQQYPDCVVAEINALPSADAVPQSEQYKKGFEDAKKSYLVEYARESRNMRKRQLEVIRNAYRAISAEAVPHGRLIDADSLISDLEEWKENPNNDDSAVDLVNHFIGIIRTAPSADAVHIHNDGTLEVKVPNAQKVGRVLVMDTDSHIGGGLFYPDDADRPHGEWKHTITWQPYCSNCEYVFGEDEEFSPFWKYCPMCGARMKGGAE